MTSNATRRRPHRYAIAVLNRRTGGRIRFTISRRLAALLLTSVLALPMLVGLGFKWSARAEIARLEAEAELLDVENRSYRQATGALAAQIQELQSTMTELGERAQLDPTSVKAIEKLPPYVRAQAVGGPTSALSGSRQLFAPALNPPDDTFGVLRDLLHGLESRLRLVQVGVERREALAAATPTIWPAHGWLTDVYGRRKDPFTGEPGFHTGLDISTEHGQPIYATAHGTVRSASRNGAYGNQVVIDHGFGLQTRYAHLQRFNVKPNDRVQRGDVIGFVGATGRATGAHVHYEIVANGRMLNPLKFLIERGQP